MLTHRYFKQAFQRPGVESTSWRTAAPLILWSMLIFVLSAVPGNEYPQVSWLFADKAVHFSLYLFLGAFASLCFNARGFGYWMPVLYCLLYGLSDELHQFWVPLRSPSLSDWYADAVGAITGVYTFQLFKLYLNSLSTNKAVSDNDSVEPMELT